MFFRSDETPGSRLPKKMISHQQERSICHADKISAVPSCNIIIFESLAWLRRGYG